MVHDGVMRRSEEEAVDLIKSGMSRVVAIAIAIAVIGRWEVRGTGILAI